MNTLALTEALWRDLTSSLSDERETAGILLAGSADAGPDMTLLGRQIEPIPSDDYIARDAVGLSIRSSGYVPSLKKARGDNVVPIFFHTHPRGRPWPSDHDVKVNEQLADLFRSRADRPYYVNLIVGGLPSRPTFTGQVFRASGGPPEQLHRLRVIGRRWTIIPAADVRDDAAGLLDELFDRQLQAFGSEGQRLISRLRVGVVGAGGTGSAVCEQLIRLGVGSLVVLDDDVLTLSNLTRIHESAHDDVARHKVDIVADSARRIGTGVAVRALNGNVAFEEGAREMRSCDVIFGCTDDSAGRAVLSRLSYWYLMPLIDTGFVISSSNGKVTGLFGRVTTVLPGEACLICRGRVDPADVRNQLMSTEERTRLASEGYAPGLGQRDPAVMPYTTLVGSIAVSELLARLFGIADGGSPSEIILLLHDRRLRTNRVEPDPLHYCADPDNWGRGDEAPLLSQMWPSSAI